MSDCVERYYKQAARVLQIVEKKKPVIPWKVPIHVFMERTLSTELNDLRRLIWLRKVSLEQISLCNVTENLAEHGIHRLSCYYINDIINLLA